ncbi:MAG TPA: SDR family oxidoreductase [Stellaceae bacterium]|nr:SDR family oxidoreductase [Stellaceae bacterium]
MRILVTGASGHFGGTAARRLLERMPARDLILMSRKPERLTEFAAAGCEIRYGDFDDPASLEAAARGADKMLLISGLKVGWRVAQHGNAIDAARRAGVGHIVYTSYIGATAENPAMVTIDHYGTEQLLKASGIAWTAMRDGMYMESMIEAAAPAALKTGKWVSASGGGRNSFVDRSECVDCAVEVLLTQGHENRVYNVTGTELLSFPDLAAMVSEIAGKPIEYVELDEAALYAHFDAMGIPRDPLVEFNIDGYAWCSNDIVSYERGLRGGHFEVTSNDIRLLLGRDPKPFRAFAEERADWLRSIAG